MRRVLSGSVLRILAVLLITIYVMPETFTSDTVIVTLDGVDILYKEIEYDNEQIRLQSSEGTSEARIRAWKQGVEMQRLRAKMATIVRDQRMSELALTVIAADVELFQRELS